MKRAGTLLLSLLLPLVLAPIGTGNAVGAPCAVESAPHRTALLELYTSEGCSSCPPADRWISGLASRGLARDRVVVLGFHVDYWNHLGWPDPYSQRTFGERQSAASRRNGARFVYTPQLLLDGKDYRRGLRHDDIAERVARINREKPDATIRLEASNIDETHVSVTVGIMVPDTDLRRTSDLFLAILENRLGNHVTAGENLGRRLQHDFVVRSFAGPFALVQHERLERRIRIDPAWKRDDLLLAAFAQDRTNGRVLQALNSICPRHLSKKQ